MSSTEYIAFRKHLQNEHHHRFDFNFIISYDSNFERSLPSSMLYDIMIKRFIGQAGCNCYGRFLTAIEE